MTLNVYDSHLDALTIGAITKLSNLRYLAVTSMDVLDAQPSDLAALAKLEHLRLWILNSPVTDREIARFAAIAPTLNKTMPALKQVEGPTGAVFKFTSQK
jgi:hypothetical protein